MKVVIDRANCVSCGTCWENCPDVFEESEEDSQSRIVKKFRLDGDIAAGIPSPDFEDCAANAAKDCCAEVISIEEG